jgi:hypothetical protein
MRVTRCEERPRLTYLLLLVLLAILALWATHANAQGAYNMDRDSGKIITSGGTWTHTNRIGSLNITFELLINGSPTSSTITIQGCGRGNQSAYGSSNGLNGLAAVSATCDTLDTFTANINANRKITGLYDYFLVTATWSGGASQSVQVNTLETSASSPLSANDPCQSSAVAKQSVTVNISAAGTTQFVGISGTLSIYVCGFYASAAGTSPSLQFEYGGGTTCTSPTALTGVILASTTVPLELASGLTNFKAPSGTGLCGVAGGTTPNLQGVLTYVQAP